MVTKVCPGCKVEKPYSEYHKLHRTKDGCQNRCKMCVAEYQQSRPDRGEYHRKRYHENKDQYNDNFYKRTYGISLEEYNKMLEAQNGTCAICFEAPSIKRLAVDHDHETGKVRGLLCSNCNLGLGYLRDSWTVLSSAMNYLERNDD